jgi:hypothetical protein
MEQGKRETIAKTHFATDFNGLSPKELAQQFPLPLDFSQKNRARLSFVITNIGNTAALDPLISVHVAPKTVKVDHADTSFANRPNHHRYQVKGINILPVETGGTSYDFTVDVWAPKEVETFHLTFRIIGDNISAQELPLEFRISRPVEQPVQ